MPAAGVDPLHTTAHGNAGWLLFRLAFVALWIGILAHEAAHFVVAVLIHYRQHLEAGIWNSREELLVVAAGPLTTMAVLAACTIRTSIHRATTSATVWTALGLAAASRIAIVAPSALLARGVNDEITVSRILGLSPRTMWALEFLLTALMVWTLLGRVEKISLRPLCIYTGLGIAVGWLSLFTIGRAIGLPI